MKRLLILIFLSLLLFNWIGYQLFTSLADQFIKQDLTAQNTPDYVFNPKNTPAKIPGFSIPLFVRDLDSDDLWEFTGGSGYAVNANSFDCSDNLFSDQATKANHRTSFKCFNGEYYSRLEQFLNHPGQYQSEKLPDRYIIISSPAFLNLIDHPPQSPVYC